MNTTPRTPVGDSQTAPQAAPGEGDIRVDGFAQVLAMLRIADPQFRESLLRRLGARDPELARQLRAELD
jgi:hypothetical protein